MILRAALALVAAGSGPAFAAPGGTGEQALHRLLSSTVKIVSELRNGDAQLNGSGLLFQSKNEIYVVTSDHVVFHSDDLAEHRIYENEGNAALGSCTLVRVTYEYGLALLKCTLARPYPVYEFFQGPGDYDGAAHLGPIRMASPWYETDPNYLQNQTVYSVYVAGYPLASSSLLVDSQGETRLHYKDPDPLIMGIIVMQEVVRIHSEKGMSGGVLFQRSAQDSEPPQILAMLSHERKVNFGGGKDSLVFAIPAQYVNSFIRSALGNPARKGRIRQEVRNQLRGPYDVAIGMYDFEYLEQERDGKIVRAFRLRKIGHFPKEPVPPQTRDFESTLDAYLPKHPGCVPYLVASWGLMGGARPVYSYGLKWITNAVKTLEGQDLSEEEPLIYLRCPGTAEAIAKLEGIRARFAAFKMGAPSNELVTKADGLIAELNARNSTAEIPDYGGISVKSRDFTRLLKTYATLWAQLAGSGREAELRGILQDAAAALEPVTL
jgi:hypothetical protein